MIINKPKDGEYRYKTKFLWFPKRFDGGWYWLETVTIRQLYLYHGVWMRGWADVCYGGDIGDISGSVWCR